MQPRVEARLEGDEVVLDANHPLAGMTLRFDVVVVSVREATGSEIDSGLPDGIDA